jgi:cell division protein ZapE
MNLNKLFKNFCKKNNLEINHNQLDLIEELDLFYNQNFNKSLLKKIFTKQNYKK